VQRPELYAFRGARSPVILWLYMCTFALPFMPPSPLFDVGHEHNAAISAAPGSAFPGTRRRKAARTGTGAATTRVSTNDMT